MFKKLFSLMAFSFLATTGLWSAEIQYDINDIDTLQTHSSEAIALNNQGQILGWYNIDGSKEGKHFFVRDRDGTFHEIPEKTPGTNLVITWRFLTEASKVYGTFPVAVKSIQVYVFGVKLMGTSI